MNSFKKKKICYQNVKGIKEKIGEGEKKGDGGE